MNLLLRSTFIWMLMCLCSFMVVSTAHASPRCETFDVPVTIDGFPGAVVYAELCVPRHGGVPDTVAFLVHGSSYDHTYWDFPVRPNHTSFVRDMVRAGFATLNIDRIGVGRSSAPPSTMVTLPVVLDTLHQIMVQLRSGQIGGHAFERIVYFGNSLSSAYGWILAGTPATAADIDLLVLTGLTHMTRGSFLGMVQAHTQPANLDPRWAGLGLDSGYIATVPGWRDDFFYHVPNARQRIIEADDALSAYVSVTLIQQSTPLVWSPETGRAPVEGDAAIGVEVPTLLVIGEYDATTCGGPDGIVCTQANIEALEAPYWQPGILDVRVIENTGHALPLHESGSESTSTIVEWLEDHLPGGC